MKIMIIRHAEPDYSIDSLTEKGFKEAKLLSLYMKDRDIDDFYCSPLGRAKDTAVPTMEYFKDKKLEILPWLEEFRGTAVNQDGKEVMCWDFMPWFWKDRKEMYSVYDFRDGELAKSGSYAEKYNYVTSEFNKLMLERYGFENNGVMYKTQKNDKRTIVFFCHFALGTVLVSHLTGIAPTPLMQGFMMAPSSVTTFISEERKKGEVIFRCNAYGDTSHLYKYGEKISPAGRFSEVYNKDSDREQGCRV